MIHSFKNVALCYTCTKVNCGSVSDPIFFVTEPKISGGTLYVSFHPSSCQIRVAFLHVVYTVEPPIMDTLGTSILYIVRGCAFF